MSQSQPSQGSQVSLGSQVLELVSTGGSAALLSQPFQDANLSINGSPVAPPPSSAGDALPVDRFVPAFAAQPEDKEGPERWMLVWIGKSEFRQDTMHRAFSSGAYFAIDQAISAEYALADGDVHKVSGVDYTIVVDLAYDASMNRCNVANGTCIYGPIIRIEETVDEPPQREPSPHQRDHAPANSHCSSTAFGLRLPGGMEVEIAIRCASGRHPDNTYMIWDERANHGNGAYYWNALCDLCVDYSKNPGAIFRAGRINKGRSNLNGRSNKRLTIRRMDEIRTKSQLTAGRGTHAFTVPQTHAFLAKFFG